MKFLASQKLIKDGFVMHILVVYGYKKKVGTQQEEERKQILNDKRGKV